MAYHRLERQSNSLEKRRAFQRATDPTSDDQSALLYRVIRSDAKEVTFILTKSLRKNIGNLKNDILQIIDIIIRIINLS